MLAFIGRGSVSFEDWPEEPVILGFDARCTGGTVHFDPSGRLSADQGDLVFVVTAAACRRIFGSLSSTPGIWHMSVAIRKLVVEICQCDLPGAWRDTLQLAKSIELLSAVFAEFQAGTLVPVEPGAGLSELDTRRILEARRMIDQNWHEKLTLNGISRACGINRSKLTRGFRMLFNCTVADAIAEKRLTGAKAMLLATDLPVSSVGYRCGYLNNASFTRAFSRRFGVAPTQLRACWVAA
ncbi:AraC family transcriptional regulator [Stakelama sp. CBK3Z-3]|uniref:AraC family transcriptional regulator n=2 Tax=Stakelama flava TaxID=2860338 RepID=A0ABS6XJV7_9SPHN|nr:AraC family transcriptional regulator [Stakelama flava]